MRQVMDEEGSATQSKGREHTMQKAKSTLSFATAASARSSSSVGSQSTTVSHALRRMYAGDLHLVVKNLRKEQADAKQESPSARGLRVGTATIDSAARLSDARPSL